MVDLVTELRQGAPHPRTNRLVHTAADRLEELYVVVRKFCPEMEARKLLSFATAEAIFAEPRRNL